MIQILENNVIYFINQTNIENYYTSKKSDIIDLIKNYRINLNNFDGETYDIKYVDKTDNYLNYEFKVENRFFEKGYETKYIKIYKMKPNNTNIKKLNDLYKSVYILEDNNYEILYDKYIYEISEMKDLIISLLDNNKINTDNITITYQNDSYIEYTFIDEHDNDIQYNFRKIISFDIYKKNKLKQDFNI